MMERQCEEKDRSENEETLRKYDFKGIETRWQRVWRDRGVFQVGRAEPTQKYYILEMFPYPSGKLHMGHVRNYSIGDALARFMRMNGKQVLYPMGYDSLGLPAENAAIEKGVNPREWTLQRIEEMKDQQRRMGFSYDWDREVATCDPRYYRWNQWIFLRMLESGLAYRKEAPVNWCEKCETVLANEQVVDGRCWRCHSEVVTRNLTQWFFRITKYAEELLEGLDNLEGWPDHVKSMQRNWIGRSVGTEIEFEVVDDGRKIRVFTTRPDTVYGITYLVLAPEHPLAVDLARGGSQEEAVREYCRKSARKSTRERIDSKEKTGVFTGRYFINPFTGDKCPIYVADYVLYEYGTGAVMAVPAHDQRDYEFAKKFGLAVRVVIQPFEGEGPEDRAYEEPGVMVDSGEFSGMKSEEAKEAIADFMKERGWGERKVQYRLRDWLISRQRYWGTPIPVVYCDNCGTVPVPEDSLPVELPENAKFTGHGNPLLTVKEFVETKCPNCGGVGSRETDTMDTFVDSSWYFFRYICPGNDSLPFDKDAADLWMPVDQYIGGVEHAVLHLLYARFFTKVLRDLGLVSIDEPFTNLLTQGMVCMPTFRTEDGEWVLPEEVRDGIHIPSGRKVTVGQSEKMSKSKKNTVDPGLIIEKYGADTSRLFILFAAPPTRELEWSDQGVEGCYRFLNRVYRFVARHCEGIKQVDSTDEAVTEPARDVRRKLHQTIRKVTGDIRDRFQFNTAIAALMELVNDLYKWEPDAADRPFLKHTIESLVLLISPFAPHLAEELNAMTGASRLVVEQEWPLWDEDAASSETFTLVVQVNGKVRHRMEMNASLSEEEIRTRVLEDQVVQDRIEGMKVRKLIYIPGKLVNIVVSSAVEGDGRTSI